MKIFKIKPIERVQAIVVLVGAGDYTESDAYQ